MHLPAIAAVIVIIISGVLVFNNIPFGQPQPTTDKSFQATMNDNTEASASVTATPTAAPKKISPSSSAKASVKPSASVSANNSTTSNGSNNSSDSSNTNSSSGSSSSPVASPTPTPTPAAQTCDGLCFDRSSASVEVVEGTGLESGGYTSQAFNLIGDGTRGYNLNSTGLPDGISIWPSSGGFGESTFPVKIWVHKSNVPFGTYNGTITLKKGPSYSEVGTMSITVTYKQP